MARLSRRKRRAAVKRFVTTGDLEGLVSFSRQEPEAIYLVMALAFERDDALRWRALDALGQLAAVVADGEGADKVRGLIRRLLWLMNDESGGIAWHGPEAIAEVLVNVPELIGEYGRIMASFIDEDPFGPGTHWAIARVAPKLPEEFSHLKERLARAPASKDAIERGYGLLALAALDTRLAREHAHALVDDDATIVTWDRAHEALRETKVGDIAREVLGAATRAA